METTLFYAQLFGMMFLVVGLAVLLKKDYYKKLFASIEKNGYFLLMMGILALLIGMYMITYHSVWDGGFQSLISIIGWAALLKGIITLMFPQWSINLIKNVIDENGIVVMGVVASILGLVLMYFGFLV